MHRRLHILIFVFLAAALAWPGLVLDRDRSARTAAAQAETLPPGTVGETFVAEAGGFVVAMAFAPDGRLFYTVKGGFSGDQVAQVRIVENGVLRPTPFLNANVNTAGERGLLGIALDPDFASNHFVYIYKTAPAAETGTGRPSNRVLRYAEDPATQTAVAGSEMLLMDVPIGAENDPNTNHNGGNIHFGPDGKLYVTIGEYGRNASNAQNLGNAMGKIHRLNADGSVPADNPFVDDPNVVVKSIWTYGNRNSFDFTFDPLSGLLFFSENGPNCDDEVNLGRVGGNYGWPNACGTVPPGTIAPLYRFPAVIAITGIDFYQGPIAGWQNTLFWCSVNNQQLYHATLDETRMAITSVEVVQGAPACGVDVQHGPDGALYLSVNNTISRIRVAESETFFPIVMD